MSLAVELIGICLVVPAAVAAIVAWATWRYPSGIAADHFAVPAAVAIAFVAAYGLLPDWAAFIPQPNWYWHWIPYLAAIAGLCSAAGLGAGKPVWLRWLFLLPLALGAALLLVPTWPTLRPPRPASIAILAAYLACLMLGLDAVARRLKTHWFLAISALTGFLLAGLLADTSFRYAQLASLPAAAIAGCSLAAALTRRENAANARSSAPIYAILIGGMAYVGCIEPEEPRWWLLLIPAGPLLAGLVARWIRPYRASEGSAQ